jgi:hypothetical protein
LFSNHQNRYCIVLDRCATESTPKARDFSHLHDNLSILNCCQHDVARMKIMPPDLDGFMEQEISHWMIVQE